MTVNVTNAVGANNTIVLDGNSKIPAFDGSQVTALSATVFTTGTLATARIDVGTTAGKVLQLDSSARIPALSGANLVNAPGPTVSTSDPALDTNSTLGAKWINKTSGEVYICTDATAGANVWTNVGAGTGDVKLQFEGESYGYNSGGRIPAKSDMIQKWSFASDGNATDVANLTVARDDAVGTQSKTYSYVSAGNYSGTGHLIIDKHQFATTNNSTSVGNLINNGYLGAGVSSSDYGYHIGGDEPVDNVIQRFSFTTDGNATDVGNLTVSRQALTGCSDWTNDYGYAAGGYPNNNVIDRFAFGSSSNATDVGDLISAQTEGPAGTSSATHGYVIGGNGQPSYNNIQKFAFASSGNATDIGDMTDGRYGPTGSSSTTHGYVSGGNISTGTSYTNIIDKHSHVTDGNATDVGDLLAARSYSMGTHV